MSRLGKFLTAVTGLAEQPSAFLEIRAKVKGQWPSKLCTTAQEAEAVVRSVREQGDVYFGVALRRECTGSPTKQDVLGAKALWADLDISENPIDGSKAWQLFGTQVLPPSYVVSTGHGLHLYWILKEFLTDLDELEYLNRALAETVPHADNVGDAVRIMRVPGTFNRKKGENLPVLLLEEQPQRIYSPATILAFTTAGQSVRDIMLSGSTQGFTSRSERDWKVIVELAAKGASYETTEALFAVLPVGDKFRESGTTYLQRSYDNASRRAKVITSLQKWGLFEARDAYWKPARIPGRKKGDEEQFTQVSTFALDVDKVLQGPAEDIIMVEVRSNGRTWHHVTMPQSAFGGLPALQRHLVKAEWSWLGTDADVRRLLPMLLDSLPPERLRKVIATETLGHQEGVWVGNEQTIAPSGEELGTENAPIIYVAPKREAPAVLYRNLRGIADTEVFSLIEQLNEPGVIWPILSWFVATFLKEAMRVEIGLRFPHLHCFGIRGGGKTTTLQRVMLPLVGVKNPTPYNCNTTQFVLLSLMGSSLNVPVALSEFRHSTLSKQEYARILRLLLMAYDAGTDARGRADQSTVTYPLTAPVTLDGEDLIADAAMHERIVAVNMRPEAVAPGTPSFRAYNQLDFRGVRAQSGPLLLHMLNQDVTTLYDDVERTMRWTFREYSLPDRVANNHIVLSMGALAYLRLLGREAEFGPAFVTTAFETTIANVVEKGLGRTRLQVDDFVEGTITYLSKPSASSAFLHRYDPEIGVVWLHWTGARDWWRKERRQQGQEVLGDRSLYDQLKERTYDENDPSVEPPPGKYAVGPKVVSIHGSTHRCFGINLAVAKECGLDVPEAIMSQTTITLNL